MEISDMSQVNAIGRRGRPSAADRRRRMAELLRVARAQFVRNGYHRTTMSGIAAAAGLTKRTLYLWHTDKAALFRACLLEGAARFPTISSDVTEPPREALGRYLAALIKELAAEDANAMGRLFLREGTDFPEMAPIVESGYRDYIIAPLARYLRQQGLEEAESVERTELLVMMALAPVHNGLLLGRAMPGAKAAEQHARFVVEFFLERTTERSNAVAPRRNSQGQQT
jgi:AcrR family transcriptional regulator